MAIEYYSPNSGRRPAPVLLALGISLLVTTAFPRALRAAGETDLIMLILVDAMRPDHMGTYGYQKPTTPVFDEVAKEGVKYTRAYVNAPWTRPSTASFLTGLNASRHRTETDKSKLPREVTTLAQRLKKAGYTTAGFTANGNGGSLAALQKGFDVFEDPSTTYPRKVRGKTYCCNGLPSGEFLTKRVIDWMEKDKSPKKFVFVFYVDPHDPYGAPERLEKQFLGNHKGKVRRHALWETGNDYPESERRSMIALYDAGIRFADESFGTLRSYLKKKKLYKGATIAISADHGEGFGEHGFYLHAHHFWEEVIKVPLILRGPGITPGKTDTRLTQSIDVVKTLAEAGGASSKGLPGYDLKGSAEAPHIISEYNEFGIKRQAIIGERYKVIWQRPADEAWYLRVAKKKEYFPSVSFDKEVIHVFDLREDPGEKVNLRSTMPGDSKDLLQALRAFVATSERTKTQVGWPP